MALHGVYWLLTHPVNNFWLQEVKLDNASGRFFAFDPAGRTEDAAADWTVFRDRWEYSHVLRAGLGLLSLTLLAVAVTI